MSDDMCQADDGVKGETSSSASPPLQSSISAEAKIHRLRTEISFLRLQIEELSAGDDEKLMLVRLKNDADVESMDRAELLQKIANLEAKYRFADLDGCVTSYLRKAAKETFAGNCSFVDDDLRLMTFCARWALQNGIPDELCPNVFPKAKAALAKSQIEEAERSVADEVAAVESIISPDTSDQIDLEEAIGKAMMP